MIDANTGDDGRKWAVRGRNGDSVVASDEARDTAAVEVVSPAGEMYATVGGSGEITNGD